MTAALYPVSTIAKLLKITERRVQQLTSEGVIPKAERGKYELVASVQGYVSYLHDRGVGKDDLSIDAYQERARLLKAQADKVELEVLTMRGALIPVEEAEFAWANLLAAFRARMLALPTRVAHAIQPHTKPLTKFSEIEGMIREHVNEGLNELVYECRNINFAAPGNDGGAAAEPESEPVGGSVPAVEQRSLSGTRQMVDEPSALPEGNDGCDTGFGD